MKKKLLILTALICVSLVSIIVKRVSIYDYDTKQDYEYDFDKTNANIIDLNIEGGKVEIPKLDSEWDTAILKVTIKATLLGHILQPNVEVKSDELACFQYFEYGAAGIRYINMSQFIAAGSTEIRLKGKNVRLKDQRAKLILFNNPDINDVRILVLSPHPDDAEIAAFGLYSSNKNSYVVTIAAGDGGCDQYNEIYKDKVQHYRKKGKLRVWNSITVPLLGGIKPEHALNLGYFDGTLKRMYAEKATLIKSISSDISDIYFFRSRNVSDIIADQHGTSTWNSLVSDLEYLLNAIKPNIIVAPYPAIDANPDHEFTTIALIEAIKKLKLREGYLYLYTNHFVLSEYYPYGEMRSLVTLPPNVKNALYFDSIYSHFLPIEKQNDKLFALEAMNDLRLDTEWRTFCGIIKKAIKITLKRILGMDISYFRLAVRNNELFYVVKIRDIYDDTICEKLKGKIRTLN